MNEPGLPRWSGVALLVLCVACAPDRALTSTAPHRDPLTSQGTTPPVFLSLATGAPPLVAATASFYAVRGEDREVILWYGAAADSADSSKVVRLRVPKRSLCSRTDGSPIAQGDSLLITLTIIDAARQVVQFEPAGLTFCPGRPARLTMWYHEADHDFDGDGDIDAEDLAFEGGLRIWRQASATAPWVAQASTLDVVDDELESDLTGFSNYVVAY